MKKRYRKGKDISGQVFGRLVALERIGSYKHGGALWSCWCSCGNYLDVPASRIINGNTKSCGCLASECHSKTMSKLFYIHGLAHSKAAQLHYAAKGRAKRSGIPFDITIEHVNELLSTVKYCPICQTKLESHTLLAKSNSASLDKFIPKNGYTKDNVSILCFRCNSIKRDATIEDLKQILAWMQVRKSEMT